ncbi:RNA helicase-domain-containing protein [Dunaliella salina]|uniref:RNA helicase-domain-containing protein n=1 Tax=Dunaliella salina TaxID=3046 RepID=A0ABQ7GCY0_DUNSA|nr:RNA helicase-domain-containing protein [Dunaliella salina]|eukprot:KAF5832475.1 RNA helicase-domain-containing protein [Dunaliella salina]
MESQPLVTQSDIGQLSLGYGASQPFQLTQNTDLTQTSTWNDDFFSSRPQISSKAAANGGGARLASDLEQLRFDDGLDEEDAQAHEPPPEHACKYCGVSNPASVVKCLTTGKWFCNGRANKSGSCIVLHLVKSKCKEVQLHKESPLGDAILECYASGTRNVFVLGFVPVKSENTVVLLARDTPANHPTIKDLNLDMSQWQPIIENRALVSWLVKPPTTRELAKAQHLTYAQIAKLEECWMSKPNATLEDVDHATAEDEGTEVIPVALRYTDVHQYNSVFKLLVKLEADYDRAMKESQVCLGLEDSAFLGRCSKRGCLAGPADYHQGMESSVLWVGAPGSFLKSPDASSHCLAPLGLFERG